jgi:hypothetical protein
MPAGAVDGEPVNAVGTRSARERAGPHPPLDQRQVSIVMRRPMDRLRWYRVSWWSVAVALTAVGTAGSYLLLGTGPAVFVGLLSAAVAGLTAWQVKLSGNRRALFQRPRLLGLAGALVVLGTVGLILAIGVAGAGVTLLVAAAGWPLLRSPGRRAGPVPAGALPAPAHPTAQPLPALPALTSVSTPTLCWLWRTTYVRLHGSPTPSETVAVIRLRRECLDELEQRDSSAFGRWLPTARAASDPARFFCPDAA